MAIVCIVGPWFVPHQYTTIYADYVRTPPSLSAYPQAEMIETALGDAVKRMRVDLKEWRQEGERIFVTVTSSREIDDRNIRYLDRSDTFDDAKVESKSPDGTGGGDERFDQAAILPVRHRQYRPRPACRAR